MRGLNIDLSEKIELIGEIGDVERRREELYFLGVTLRNYFEEIDYVYKIFEGAYEYFSEVIVYESGSEIEMRERFESYLRKLRVFEDDVIPELVDIWFSYELYKVEFRQFCSLMYEIKEKMKEVVYESIPDEIKNDVYFKRGFEGVG